MAIEIRLLIAETACAIEIDLRREPIKMPTGMAEAVLMSTEHAALSCCWGKGRVRSSWTPISQTPPQQKPGKYRVFQNDATIPIVGGRENYATKRVICSTL
jgi:hypothetical protein